MLDKARPATKPLLEKAAKPFLKLHPNTITFIGFLGGILFFLTMSQELYWGAFAMFFVVLVDSMDGTVARLTGKESQFGEFFDSTLDRFTDALLILAFAAAGLISWPLAASVAIMSLMISYTRGKAEAILNNKIKLTVGIIERPERLIGVFIATVLAATGFNPILASLSLIEWIFALLLVLSFITVIQRINKAHQLLAK